MNITAKVALRMIPDSLATQPIFLCVDDTMVAKAGTRSGGILKQATMSRKPSGHFAGIWYEAARVLKCWRYFALLILVVTNRYIVNYDSFIAILGMFGSSNNHFRISISNLKP